MGFYASICYDWRMEKETKEISKTIEELEKIILLQQKEIEKHKQEIISYKERYIRLLEEIKLEKTRRYTSSSEKNIFQPDLFDEPGMELVDELKDQLDDTLDVECYTRKKHPVRKPIPKDIPREVIIHDIPQAEKMCTCGLPLVQIGEAITEQIKYIPAQLSVVQHLRPKYACKPCQENVKMAPIPPFLLPKCIATPELVAYTIVAKYGDHIPLYRQEAIWQRFGIDMPRSSLCGWLMKVSELCKPLIKLNQTLMLAQDYVQADETSVQVLNEMGRDNKSKSTMWCYRGGGDKPIIIYEYQPTRGGYHAESFLTGFKGYLQSDAYAGYNFADKHHDIIKVGCMAHARRKFADIIKIAKSNGLAHEAINFFKALYKIEKEARENNLSYAHRFKLREQKAKPILAAFKTWLDAHLTKTPVQSKIGEAIRYMLSNWECLANYLRDGQIEIDNNLIENAIRPFALGRKNWLFNGSPSGAKAGAIFYSLIETCKANHIEPYKYFSTMLHHLRSCNTKEDYHKFLPQFIEL
jgi:transposase